MRKPSPVTIIAGVAILITLLACGSGGSGDSNTGTGPQQNTTVETKAVKQTLTMKDSGSEVSVLLQAVDTKAVSDNKFSQPKRGQFVAITVEITAAKGSNDVGPSNFRFVGADGNVSLAEFLVVGIEPGLDASTTIQEGQKKSGKVVFDVDPAKIAGGKIQLSTDGGNPVGYWTF